MNPERLVACVEVVHRPERIGADEHTSLGPPEGDFLPRRPIRIGMRSNGGRLAVGTTWCGTPRRFASSAQSRLCRSSSCRTPAGLPAARIRSSTPSPSSGSITQTRPSSTSACEQRAMNSSTIQPKPPSNSSQNLTFSAATSRPSLAKSGKSAAFAAADQLVDVERDPAELETSSSSLTIAYSLQGKNGTGSSGSLCS